MRGILTLAAGTAVLLAGVTAPLTAATAAAAEPRLPQVAGEPTVRAFVSILPQAALLERIGGPRVAVDVLVGPGQSPHSMEPTPRQMAALARGQVFFAIGWPFEKRILQKATALNPDLRVVDTREGIPMRRLTADEARLPDGQAHPEAADAGHADEHAHPAGDPDPHIWLSPRLLKIQAATMARTLRQVDPAHGAEYDARLKTLQDDLDRTDARVAAVLAPLKGKEFFVFHPSFGYFGDAYGLRQVPVEIDGKEPSARQLAQLIDRAKARGVRVIFVQPQFSAKSAEAVARAIGGAVVPIDPLARDVLANLQEMAERIAGALTPQ